MTKARDIADAIINTAELADNAVTSSVPLSLGEGSDPTTTSFLRLTSNDGTNVLITDHREIS
jgi:hypothetical protein